MCPGQKAKMEGLFSTSGGYPKGRKRGDLGLGVVRTSIRMCIGCGCCAIWKGVTTFAGSET